MSFPEGNFSTKEWQPLLGQVLPVLFLNLFHLVLQRLASQDPKNSLDPWTLNPSARSQTQGSMGNSSKDVRIPSGERLHSNGKIHPLLMGKSTLSMAIFNCYVSSPKGSFAMFDYHRACLAVPTLALLQLVIKKDTRMQACKKSKQSSG